MEQGYIFASEYLQRYYLQVNIIGFTAFDQFGSHLVHSIRRIKHKNVQNELAFKSGCQRTRPILEMEVVTQLRTPYLGTNILGKIQFIILSVQILEFPYMDMKICEMVYFLI